MLRFDKKQQNSVKQLSIALIKKILKRDSVCQVPVESSQGPSTCSVSFCEMGMAIELFWELHGVCAEYSAQNWQPVSTVSWYKDDQKCYGENES